MKKQLLSLGFISLVTMQSIQSAQFARRVGKFLWAPSIGLGTLAAGSCFAIVSKNINTMIDDVPEDHGLDPEFVQIVQDEAKRRGLHNVNTVFCPMDLNMGSAGNTEKSVVLVGYNFGVSLFEKTLEKIIINAKKNNEELLKSWWLSSSDRKKVEENLKKIQSELDSVKASQASPEQTLFILGHELSHIESGDSNKKNVVNSLSTLTPFAAWRAARLAGRGRLVACGVAGLGFLSYEFTKSLLYKRMEYNADDNASQDPQILEAGAQLNDRFAAEAVNITKKMFSSHPDPIDRAKRLRAHAAQLRAEQAQQTLEEASKNQS